MFCISDIQELQECITFIIVVPGGRRNFQFSTGDLSVEALRGSRKVALRRRDRVRKRAAHRGQVHLDGAARAPRDEVDVLRGPERYANRRDRPR